MTATPQGAVVLLLILASSCLSQEALDESQTDFEIKAEGSLDQGPEEFANQGKQLHARLNLSRQLFRNRNTGLNLSGIRRSSNFADANSEDGFGTNSNSRVGFRRTLDRFRQQELQSDRHADSSNDFSGSQQSQSNGGLQLSDSVSGSPQGNIDPVEHNSGNHNNLEFANLGLISNNEGNALSQQISATDSISLTSDNVADDPYSAEVNGEGQVHVVEATQSNAGVSPPLLDSDSWQDQGSSPEGFDPFEDSEGGTINDEENNYPRVRFQPGINRGRRRFRGQNRRRLMRLRRPWFLRRKMILEAQRANLPHDEQENFNSDQIIESPERIIDPSKLLNPSQNAQRILLGGESSNSIDTTRDENDESSPDIYSPDLQSGAGGFREQKSLDFENSAPNLQGFFRNNIAQNENNDNILQEENNNQNGAFRRFPNVNFVRPRLRRPIFDRTDARVSGNNVRFSNFRNEQNSQIQSNRESAGNEETFEAGERKGIPVGLHFTTNHHQQSNQEQSFNSDLNQSNGNRYSFTKSQEFSNANPEFLNDDQLKKQQGAGEGNLHRNSDSSTEEQLSLSSQNQRRPQPFRSQLNTNERLHQFQQKIESKRLLQYPQQQNNGQSPADQLQERAQQRQQILEEQRLLQYPQSQEQQESSSPDVSLNTQEEAQVLRYPQSQSNGASLPSTISDDSQDGSRLLQYPQSQGSSESFSPNLSGNNQEDSSILQNSNSQDRSELLTSDNKQENFDTLQNRRINEQTVQYPKRQFELRTPGQRSQRPFNSQNLLDQYFKPAQLTDTFGPGRANIFERQRQQSQIQIRNNQQTRINQANLSNQSTSRQQHLTFNQGNQADNENQPTRFSQSANRNQDPQFNHAHQNTEGTRFNQNSDDNNQPSRFSQLDDSNQATRFQLAEKNNNQATRYSQENYNSNQRTRIGQAFNKNQATGLDQSNSNNNQVGQFNQVNEENNQATRYNQRNNYRNNVLATALNQKANAHHENLNYSPESNLSQQNQVQSTATGVDSLNDDESHRTAGRFSVQGTTNDQLNQDHLTSTRQQIQQQQNFREQSDQWSPNIQTGSGYQTPLIQGEDKGDGTKFAEISGQVDIVHNEQSQERGGAEQEVLIYSNTKEGSRQFNHFTNSNSRNPQSNFRNQNAEDSGEIAINVDNNQSSRIYDQNSQLQTNQILQNKNQVQQSNSPRIQATSRTQQGFETRFSQGNTYLPHQYNRIVQSGIRQGQGGRFQLRTQNTVSNIQINNGHTVNGNKLGSRNDEATFKDEQSRTQFQQSSEADQEEIHESDMLRERQNLHRTFSQQQQFSGRDQTTFDQVSRQAIQSGEPLERQQSYSQETDNSQIINTQYTNNNQQSIASSTIKGDQQSILASEQEHTLNTEQHTTQIFSRPNSDIERSRFQYQTSKGTSEEQQQRTYQTTDNESSALVNLQNSQENLNQESIQRNLGNERTSLEQRRFGLSTASSQRRNQLSSSQRNQQESNRAAKVIKSELDATSNERTKITNAHGQPGFTFQRNLRPSSSFSDINDEQSVSEGLQRDQQSSDVPNFRSRNQERTQQNSESLRQGQHPDISNTRLNQQYEMEGHRQTSASVTFNRGNRKFLDTFEGLNTGEPHEKVLERIAAVLQGKDYSADRADSPKVPVISGTPRLTEIPNTGFRCEGRVSGYYADSHELAKCQSFHFCGIDGTKISYLCPTGTAFNQRLLVCDHMFRVECSNSADYYYVNERLYGANVHQSLQDESRAFRSFGRRT